MVSRATFVYIIMLVVFGAGLWAIISFGSILLRAPEDLAGEWQLFAPGSTRDGVGDDKPVKKMSIEQSGKFFKLHLNGTALDMTLAAERRYPERAIDKTELHLGDARGTTHARFDGEHDGHAFDVRFSGDVSGTWLARRVANRYGPVPESQQDKPTTRPTTSPAAAAAQQQQQQQQQQQHARRL
jgi:hypothetical protein